MWAEPLRRPPEGRRSHPDPDGEADSRCAFAGAACLRVPRLHPPTSFRRCCCASCPFVRRHLIQTQSVLAGGGKTNKQTETCRYSERFQSSGACLELQISRPAAPLRQTQRPLNPPPPPQQAQKPPGRFLSGARLMARKNLAASWDVSARRQTREIAANVPRAKRLGKKKTRHFDWKMLRPLASGAQRRLTSAGASGVCFQQPWKQLVSGEQLFNPPLSV